MITGNHRIFTEHDLDQLHDAVLRVLRDTGFRVCHEDFLESLAQSGVQVDRDHQVARFPPALVESFVEKRAAAAATARKQRKDVGSAYEPHLTSVIAPFVHDYERGVRRWATRQDLVDVSKWAEVDVPASQSVGLAVTMSDVAPRVEPIEAYALLLKHTSRPDHAYTTEADQIEFLVDIATVYYGKPVFPRGTDFTTSPLTFGDRLARHTLAAIRFGETRYSTGVMPICGGNAPMTVAGNIVISAAELLGTWLTIQSMQPEASFGGGACNGITDMRRGAVSFNAPEALLADLGVCELFERRYGGGVSVAAGADYIDARVPGMQAAYERTYRAMAIAAFTGQPYFMGGNGTLDEGKVFSPVQYSLECEMGEGLWRLGQGIRVDEETLAVDTIAEVGVGEGKSYLGTDHTLRHYQETWFPRYLVRGMWESDAVEFSREQRMLDQAFQHYKECVAVHEKPALGPTKLAEICKIVGKAREHLLS